MLDKNEIARQIAYKHYEIEPGITDIYRVLAEDKAEQSEAEPIRLLQVNRDTIPTGIMPFYFSAMPSIDIVHPFTIIEITPKELAKLRLHDLELPNGWKLGDRIDKPLR